MAAYNAVMSSGRADAVQPVLADLRKFFGERLIALVAYGRRQQAPVASLALATSIDVGDLQACAGRVQAWHRAGAATPLVLTPDDFSRSLDAFPIEYGEILADHDLVFGADPFAGLRIRSDDLRRACEVQVKSHLLHLREDFIESGAGPAATSALVRESAPGFAALLRNLARLDNFPASTARDVAAYATRRLGLDAHVVGDLLDLAENDGLEAVDGSKVFPEYLKVVEQLATFVDRWRRS
jgi:hypothetical protein